MPRNIVLCFDDLYGIRSSNVVRLYRTLAQDLQLQTTYYTAGIIEQPLPLGGVLKLVKRFLGLGFGAGLFEELRSAYNFLMQTYNEGDKIFFFGVGRGAYVARTLAGILHLSGLIRPGNEALVPYAIRIASKLDDETFEAAIELKKTFSRECPIYFVGVWETPAQFGWIFNPFPLRIPFSTNNPGILIGRHAIAIDERRALFQPSLWLPLASPRAGPRDLKQVWFAGVHSDVCGGYPELESGLSKISLDWMLREAIECGLVVNSMKMRDILGLNDSTTTARPDASALMHESLRDLWWLWEFIPLSHFDLKTARMHYKFHLGRPRVIPEGALIHQSALERSGGYHYQLPKGYSVESGSASTRD